MNFKVGDKIRPRGSGSDYLEVLQIDSVTHPLPHYLVQDSMGAFWDYCIGWEKQISPDDVLRYGEILTDDIIHNFGNRGEVIWTRIKTIRYEDHVYYHKMVDGEVEEFKELM